LPPESGDLREVTERARAFQAALTGTAIEGEVA
jgi:hypothetical protein